MKPQSKVRLVTASLALVSALAPGAFAQAPTPPPAPPNAAAPAPPAAVTQAPVTPPAPPGAAGPPPPPAPPAAAYNYAQLTVTQGTVQRFTPTPIGEIDGLILADGTEIHVPPHLTSQLASAVHIGDKVMVQGYRSPSVPLVVAASITDANTGQTVVDNGPPPPGSVPPPPPPGTPTPGAQQVSVQGKVQGLLYGPAGDVNGALLDDGTTVRVGPREAYLVAPVLSPGANLAVQGWALTTLYGRVIDAQAVGPSLGQLTQVAPPWLGPGAPPPPPPVPPRP
jgi:hypothetical protein